jgi:hypothetical protein
MQQEPLMRHMHHALRPTLELREERKLPSTSIPVGNGNGGFTNNSVTTPSSVATLVTPSGHANQAGRGLAVAARHAQGVPFAAAGSADGTVGIASGSTLVGNGNGGFTQG